MEMNVLNVRLYFYVFRLGKCVLILTFMITMLYHFFLKFKLIGQDLMYQTFLRHIQVMSNQPFPWISSLLYKQKEWLNNRLRYKSVLLTIVCISHYHMMELSSLMLLLQKNTPFKFFFNYKFVYFCNFTWYCQDLYALYGPTFFIPM